MAFHIKRATLWPRGTVDHIYKHTTQTARKIQFVLILVFQIRQWAIGCYTDAVNLSICPSSPTFVYLIWLCSIWVFVFIKLLFTWDVWNWFRCCVDHLMNRTPWVWYDIVDIVTYHVVGTAVYILIEYQNIRLQNAGTKGIWVISTDLTALLQVLLEFMCWIAQY